MISIKAGGGRVIDDDDGGGDDGCDARGRRHLNVNCILRTRCVKWPCCWSGNHPQRKPAYEANGDNRRNSFQR